MSLPAQKARPRPATMRTRTSSRAATSSSAWSRAAVNGRFSALSAAGRFEIQPGHPVARLEVDHDERSVTRAIAGRGRPSRARRRQSRASRGDCARSRCGRRGSRREGRAPPRGLDGTVDQAVDQLEAGVDENFGGGLGEIDVGHGGMAHVALTAVAQRVVAVEAARAASRSRQEDRDRFRRPGVDGASASSTSPTSLRGRPRQRPCARPRVRGRPSAPWTSSRNRPLRKPQAR